MFWGILALLILSLWGCRRSHVDDFLSRERTSSVNAIFVLYIFLSHSRSFVGVPALISPDRYTAVLMSNFGQLCVASFLLFSGYGMSERIKAVGLEYVHNIPLKRIVPFYMNSLPVAFVWILLGCFVSSVHYPIDAVGQLVFWKGILYGPCWYNFVIIMLYAITSVSFFMFIRATVKAEISTWILSIVAIFALALFKKSEHWWYDTILAFPLGVTFSIHKMVLVELLKRFSLLIIPVAGLLCYLMGMKIALPRMTWGNIRVVIFSCGLLAVMYHVSFGNRVLSWIGKRVFPFYMVHAIFLFVLGRVIKVGGGYVVMGLSLILTLIAIEFYPLFPYKFKRQSHGNRQ